MRGRAASTSTAGRSSGHSSAGRVDEVAATVIPVVLGEGVPLFAGAAARHRLMLKEVRELGAAVVQLRYSVSS